MNHRLKFMDCQVRIHLSAVKKRYDFNRLKTKSVSSPDAIRRRNAFALYCYIFMNDFYIQGTAKLTGNISHRIQKSSYPAHRKCSWPPIRRVVRNEPSCPGSARQGL